jgi:thioredoxin:protein disulfide reductase
LRTKHLVLCAAILWVTLPVTFPAESQAKKAQTQAKPNSIQWIYNLDEGLARANDQHKTLMVEFMASWCSSCKEMEKKTFSNPNVRARVFEFVPVRIDIEQQREVAEKYNALAQKYGGIGIPNVLFLAANGTKIKHVVGYQSPKEFLAALDSVLALTRD